MKTKANIGLDFGTALWYTLNMEEKNYFEEERINTSPKQAGAPPRNALTWNTLIWEN